MEVQRDDENSWERPRKKSPQKISSERIRPYCFADVLKDNQKGKRNAELGTVIDILIHFLQAFKCYHLNPSLAGGNNTAVLLACTKSYHHEVEILRPDQDSGWILYPSIQKKHPTYVDDLPSRSRMYPRTCFTSALW